MPIFDFYSAPNHRLITQLADGRSKMISCRTPAKHCILFVHGFHGDATATWSGFDTIALNDPELAETDLIFFGYDALRSNALAASSFLFDLLDSAMTDGKALHPIRSSPPNYKSCVLAAHSLGAIVTRWALIRANQQKLSWLDNIRYILFAPAHSGGVIVDSIRELLGASALSSAISSAARAKFPLLDELRPGSTILKSLEGYTINAQSAGCTTIRARRVLIAEHEDIVSNLPFPGDPFPTAIRGATHTSVSKLDDFPHLITYVKELL